MRNSMQFTLLNLSCQKNRSKTWLLKHTSRSNSAWESKNWALSWLNQRRNLISWKPNQKRWLPPPWMRTCPSPSSSKFHRRRCPTWHWLSQKQKSFLWPYNRSKRWFMNSTHLSLLWPIRDFCLAASCCKTQTSWARWWMLRPLGQRWCGVQRRHFIWWYCKSTKTWRSPSRRKPKQREETLEVAVLQTKGKEAAERDLQEEQEQTWPMTKYIWLKAFKNSRRSCWRNIWKHSKMSKTKTKILIEEVIMGQSPEEWARTWTQMFPSRNRFCSPTFQLCIISSRRDSTLM